MVDFVKEHIQSFFNKREIILSIFLFVLFGILVARCFNLQIVNGEMYLEETTMLIQKTTEVSGTRGNIYDTNGELIAYNELSYCISIEDNGEYDTTAEKNAAINAVITELIDIVESNGDSMISDFGITVDESGEYTYTSSEGTTTRLRFLADIYGYASTSSLSIEEQEITADEMMEYLCSDSKFGIDMSTLTKEEVVTYVNIRYKISLNSYQKYIATVVAENISETTLAVVMENLSELQGVSITEDTIRCYNDSIYYSSVIGYTGVISEDEYLSYQEAGYTDYTRTEIVGKSGLEQYFDTELQGTKGEVLVYTDNIGNVIEEVVTEEAVAGNDVYLTLDSDLMEVAYNVIEETLAGIIYDRLVNVLSYDPSVEEDTEDIVIAIGDVYNAFFDNMIIDADEFEDFDAGEYEVEILALYTNRYEAETSLVMEYIQNSDGLDMSELSDEQQEYIYYALDSLLKTSNKVIMSSAIDTNDDGYKEWANGTTNAYTYLYYLISNNCIDTTLLQDYMEENLFYTDSNETFEAICAYLEEALLYDSGYEKLIYEYMIRSAELSGSLICLAAFDQGVFEYDEDEMNGLINGTITAYDFIRSKIYNIELTAGEIGLEPCSASCVITDPDTGDVLALISYPGYDVNLLANTMDSSYYSKLLQDNSSPFYNHATYEKTAPGSTFKMVSAVAGLVEGVITESTTLYCTGIFEKVYPNVQCWIYPNGHGYENVTTAIQDSCNFFFYEVAYRLSLTNRNVIGTDDSLGSTTFEYYSSDLGISTLEEYASLFGLDTTTGIETGEASPQISTSSSVPSAIGQGTNNYTTTQLARYVSAVANSGTVYDLTLVDKVTDMDGNVVIENDPVVYNEITEVTDSMWDAIQTGMELVVENHSSFTDLEEGITIAGKTGTAQQSSVKPDHALFVGYAPTDDPEVAIAVRITNGYKSAYAADIASDILQYYFGALDKDDVITGTAKSLTETSEDD